MKELLLLRHAKSKPGGPEMEDFARDLSRRGRANAAAMAVWIKARITPQLVLCSTARRTRQTVELMADLLAGVPTEDIDRLYLADARAILACIASVPDRIERLMVVGHNPGLQDLALSLTPIGTEARAAIATKFPTCAMAWFKCDTPGWSRLAGRARLHQFITPADL